MIIVYDFEVFMFDWWVVCIDIAARTYDTIRTGEDLQAYIDAHPSYIWVGYNSNSYDQWMICAALAGDNLFEVSNALINEKKSGWKLGYKPVVYGFDIMTDRDKSLKQLEGWMGDSIVECSTPWDIARPLFQDELQDGEKYCIHDAEETAKVLLNRKEEFYSKMDLIKTFKLPMAWFSKTKAQLSAAILNARKVERNDAFDLIVPDVISLTKYDHIRQWYFEPENMRYDRINETDVAGVSHRFMWGGLHAARRNFFGKGIFLNMDVASFYPAMIIEFGLMSRNVPDPSLYKKMRDDRIILKKAKDPKQAVYKIVLNGTYGATKDQYNQLYDPRMGNSICVTGQLLLLDLIEKVEPYCTLIQTNTDGILVHVEDRMYLDMVKGCAMEWEKRTRMSLDYDEYVQVMQKDVNNYIIVDADGNYKSKGAYVKKLGPMDNDMEIVNTAIVQYLLYDVPPEETIGECDDPKRFHIIIKASSKYDGMAWGNQILNEKTIRVFASRNKNHPAAYRFKREVGSIKLSGVGASPDHCFIHNESVNGIPWLDGIDRDWYIKVAWKRINDFIGKDPKQLSFF